VFTREGGTIPVVSTFKEVLGLDTILIGFGQNDDNLHSPNEKYSLDDYQKGILTSAHLLEELGQAG
jgi:acetylornithine deacetylase/succinyl-diaminopimelate desuccinylase-like protein